MQSYHSRDHCIKFSFREITIKLFREITVKGYHSERSIQNYHPERSLRLFREITVQNYLERSLYKVIIQEITV